MSLIAFFAGDGSHSVGIALVSSFNKCLNFFVGRFHVVTLTGELLFPSFLYSGITFDTGLFGSVFLLIGLEIIRCVTVGVGCCSSEQVGNGLLILVLPVVEGCSVIIINTLNYLSNLVIVCGIVLEQSLVGCVHRGVSSVVFIVCGNLSSESFVLFLQISNGAFVCNFFVLNFAVFFVSSLDSGNGGFNSLLESFGSFFIASYGISASVFSCESINEGFNLGLQRIITTGKSLESCLFSLGVFLDNLFSFRSSIDSCI